MVIDTENFTAGEKPQGGTSSPPDLKSVQSHIEHAERVLGLRASSVSAQVKSTVALSEGLEQLKDDHGQLDKFIAALCDAKLLSKSEADLKDRSASTQSKWKKIGRYAHIFLDERVLRVLTPGYSVMYELALLIEDLETES